MESNNGKEEDTKDKILYSRRFNNGKSEDSRRNKKQKKTKMKMVE